MAWGMSLVASTHSMAYGHHKISYFHPSLTMLLCMHILMKFCAFCQDQPRLVFACLFQPPLSLSKIVF
jgi:hypothetical protein